MALLIDLRARIDGRSDAAERDAVVEGHVITDFGGLADHHAHAVVDEKPPADLGAGVDLDSRQPAAQLGDEPAQNTPPAPPGGMGEAVRHQGMESRIQQHELEPRARRRVAGHHRVDFSAQALEVHEHHHDITG